MTLFLSTHQLSVAEEVADRIGIIHHGKLIALGTVTELRAQAHEAGALEKVFLSLIDQEEAHREKTAALPYGKRLPGADFDEGVNGRIQPVDLIQRGLDDLYWRQFALPDANCDLRKRLPKRHESRVTNRHGPAPPSTAG